MEYLKIPLIRYLLMTDMLYCDDADRYFEEIELAFDYYWDTAPSHVPEVLYECRPTNIRNGIVERLYERTVEYISDNCPEFSTQDDSFDEMLTSEDSESLEALLTTWLGKAVKTVEPDYTKPVEFKEAYKSWLAEPEEEL